MLKRLRIYLTLARIELAGFSMVCILGGLAVVGRDLSLRDGLGLFLGNALLVILGFVHNDLMDYDIDRRLDQLKTRPLVAGDITRREARWISAFVFILNLLLMGLLFPGPIPLICMFVAQLFTLAYNTWSKSLLGADSLYAAAAGCLALFGSSAVMTAPGALTQWSALVVIIAAIQVTEHLFFNVVSGQLKDVDYDREAGVTTLAVHCSRVVDGRTVLSPAYRYGCVLLKALSVGLVFLPALACGYSLALWQLIVLPLMALSAVGLAWQILHSDPSDRLRILDLTKRQEMMAKGMLPLMLAPTIGWLWVGIILVVPMLWFMACNYLLNKSFLSNPRTF